MLVLIVALGSQVAAPCPHAGRAAGETGAGWGFYRRGAIAEAAAHFAVADSLCPGDHGAQVGLGFVRLRQGEARAAAEHFLGATRSNAGDAEAWYGVGLARVRLGQRTTAAEAWRRTLRLAPGYEDAELQLLALGIDSGLARRPVVRPVDPDVAARTAGDGFEIRSTSGWRPFYVKGINLGVALPGHFPSDFPTDDSTYGRWLELMAGARANAVRVYTILPPAFYRSLKAWNDAHPDRALWLLHGVWTELPPGDDYDAASWKATCRITFWGSSSAGSGSRLRFGPTTRAGAIVPRSPVGFSRSIGAHQPMSGWRSSATTCSPTSGILITPNGPSRTPTGPRSTRCHTRRSPRSRRSSGCVGATASRPIRGSRNTTTTANRSTRCWCAPPPRTWRAISLRITPTLTIPTSSISIRRTVPHQARVGLATSATYAPSSSITRGDRF